jgi:predicted phage tail protein
MKIKPILALSFGMVMLAASIPAFAESMRTDREIIKIKSADFNRRRPTEPKTQPCNIQCVTTPCPCTIKTDDRDDGKQQNRREHQTKFDR